MAEKLTPREKNFSEWYVDVVLKSKLADYSDVKGCMVIRPNGYALWENIQRGLDGMFKATGHKNAYFPLLIPESFLRKQDETLRMLEVYRTFAEDWMAMPVLTGQKSDSEKFAGALRTYSIEAMMQDKKALQAGTSHNLGQNFARAFGTQFQGRDGQQHFVWQT